MTKLDIIKIFKIFLIFLTFLFIPELNNAKEVLIYADSISYDEEENIIAKGNAKIFQNNEIILSDLIIYKKKSEKILLPTRFIIKNNNNYFQAENGYITKNFEYGEFNDIKIKLEDGSRIIGTKAKRKGHIDIITKGVYSPCKSKIKIGNFICPTWQLEGEKLLHDNKNLFIYQKHSKLRVLNTPIFYVPYIVAPSPLRKERKSGFLSPQIDFSFFDTKTSQSTSLPYYFNISIDKELTFIPTFNYGGGIDSSQRFSFDYNQILSGGYFSSKLIFDSNFENQNNNKWLSDATLITKFKKNLNENYKLNIKSAIQTSKIFIQIIVPDNELSFTNSLSSDIKLVGYNLNKIDDYLEIDINFYQTNQNNEDNKTTPTVLPRLKYFTGNKILNQIKYNFNYEFYNIFRDKTTDIHSQNQQKISQIFKSDRNFIRYNSKINFKSEIYNQFFFTENKLLYDNKYHSGNYFRFFPILGINVETPFKFLKNKFDLVYTPNLQIVITPGESNSNKVSNEDSSNNIFNLSNISSLNRYSGTDKIDNSKRLKYGLKVNNSNFKLNLSQIYEFTDNSNFHNELNNTNNLSDLLGSIGYSNKNSINYEFRYDFDSNFLKEQNINTNIISNVGNIKLSYLDQKSKTNNIVSQDTETFNYSFESKEFAKYSKISFNGLYNLKKEINTEYSIGYNYFDECFGIDISFNRKSYQEENLKPQDILKLMFTFKNLGSYTTDNLRKNYNGK